MRTAIKHLILLIFVFLNLATVQSQESQKKKIIENDNYLDQSEFSIKKSNEVLDVELIGPGLGLSLNYDRRFKDGKTGLGFRTGVGISFGYTLTAASNYIIGNSNRRSFLEIGAGYTYYIHNSEDAFIRLFVKNRFIPITYIYYRYQDFEKTPFVIKFGFTQHYIYDLDYTNGRYFIPGLSIGYAFQSKKKK